MDKNALQGLDEVSVDDRHPKLEPQSRYKLKITACHLGDFFKSGLTFVIEHKVLESTSPAVVVGSTYATTITGLSQKKHKDLKLAKIKNFLSALFRVDPKSDQKWLELASYVCDTGVPPETSEVFAETGEIRSSPLGKYMITTFYPA